MGQPLMRKFMGRVADVLTEYLGGLSEDLVKDNFVTIYQVKERYVNCVSCSCLC